MHAPSEAHRLRDRAESFGQVAVDYDRHRPDYPGALLDELAALAGADPVIDIGTGTGKAAVALLGRGCDILGVEVDPLMARVARDHGVPVEVAGFETWDAAGRTFGLVTAAQAWHWVEPAAGTAKVCSLLRPGATFAPFWNFENLADAHRDACTAVYERLAPQLIEASAEAQQPSSRPYVDDLRTYGSFAAIETRTFDWTAQHTPKDWVDRVATHSDHLTLPAPLLAEVRAELVDALSAVSPSVPVTGGTYVIRARMAG